MSLSERLINMINKIKLTLPWLQIGICFSDNFEEIDILYFNIYYHKCLSCKIPTKDYQYDHDK